MNETRQSARQASWSVPLTKPLSLSVIVTVALLIGLVVRLLFLGSKGFWLDETLSINLAADPTRLLGSRFDSAHPPLYYILLHYWSRAVLPLGQPEFALRLSSALASCLAIPLSYALANQLGGRRVATTMLWLSTLAPLFVWYAQELRSYSLLMLLGLVVTLAFTHLLTRPTLWWWLLFAFAMSAALYTHYAALLLIAAQLGILATLYLQQRITRRGIKLWLAAWPIVLLLYLPWLTSPGMRAFLELLFVDTPYPVLLLAERFSLSPTVAGALLLLALALVTLLLMALVISLIRRGAASWERWATLSVVRYGVLLLFLALTVASVVPRGYTLKKLLVALWPYGLLAVAWVFPWKRLNRLPLFVLMTASLLGSLVNVTLIPKDQWREMAAYLHEHAEPTDSIWVVPRYQLTPLNFYLSQPASGDAPSPPLQWQTPDVVPSMSDEELAAMVSNGQRVWMIYHEVDFRLRDPQRRLEAWLIEHFAPSNPVHFHRIEATLYSSQP